MQIFQPTMMRTAANLSVNNSGSTVELDFDFGYGQGAKLMAVQYDLRFTGGTNVDVCCGVYLGPTKANPTGADEILEDEDVLCPHQWYIVQEAAGEQPVHTAYYDVSNLDMIITRNVRFEAHTPNAVANLVYVRLYYNRIQMTDAEAVMVMTLRR